MNDFPVQLEINRLSDTKTIENVSCYELLREIAGKRQVYDGIWDGKAVIVKIFLDPISANRHFKKEWQGMKKLQELGLNGAKPLFYGKGKNDSWVIVSENLVGAETVLCAMPQCKSKEAKIELVLKVASELARQHVKGVIQKDLHLGNFMIKDDTIYALDPGQMSFSPKALSRGKSLCNLGALAMSLPDYDKQILRDLCEKYFAERGWHFNDKDEKDFEKNLLKNEMLSIRHSQRKCLRTSKRTLKLETNDYNSVFDRHFCDNINPHEFIDQIDDLMDKGTILKNGTTCYVSRFNYNNYDIVVKKYKYKGPINLLRQNLLTSRARRNWLYANLLISVKIGTPEPFGFIEKKKGPFIWESYYISEYTDAINLYTFLANPNLTPSAREKMADRIIDLMAQMGKRGLSHGDMKRSNILIDGEKLILIDLDSMKIHGIGLTCQMELAKDIKRLGRDKPGGYKGIHIDYKKLMSKI
ncbi:MAG TPA: lipopolysaccharide kinase InaA family protein [Sedimentisphaerales bacterium]|nr:lipopolysaccharide kinase InaA family protein [Sedimentisphaerales bacterium]